MGFFEWVVVLFVAAMVNYFIANASLKKFLDENPRIESRLNISNLQEMVRKQMYQALAQIVFVGGMGVLGVVGIITDRLSFIEFIVVLGLDFIVMGFGKAGKHIENRARSMRVLDPELNAEYKEICRTWVRKALPDF